MIKYFFKTTVTLILGIMVLGIFSCTSSKKSASNENNDTVVIDSVTINNPHLIKQDSLAPGTAMVLFLKINLAENNPQKVVWETSVKEVLAYGASTPPIGIGESMQVDATGYFMNHDTSPAFYAESDSLICLISHRQRVDSPQNSSPLTWELIDILKN